MNGAINKYLISLPQPIDLTLEIMGIRNKFNATITRRLLKNRCKNLKIKYK